MTDVLNTPRLLTTEQVAEILAMTPAALRQARAAGEGPDFVRLGRRVRYLPADVKRYISSNRRKAKRNGS